jgi:hypothetical protein
MAAVTTYLFWFILLNDEREYFDSVQETTPMLALIAGGICLIASLITWGWFRYGPGRG